MKFEIDFMDINKYPILVYSANCLFKYVAYELATGEVILTLKKQLVCRYDSMLDVPSHLNLKQSYWIEQAINNV